VARETSGENRKRAHDRSHLRAFAQLSTGVAEELRASLAMSCSPRSRSVHDEAGCQRAYQERDAMCTHADGCALRRSRSKGKEVFPRQLGSSLACWWNHVRLHVLARSASSRADFDAGASTGISHSSQYLGTDLAMELVMEADWNEDSAAMKQVQIRSEWQGSFDYAVALASLRQLLRSA